MKSWYYVFALKSHFSVPRRIKGWKSTQRAQPIHRLDSFIIIYLCASTLYFGCPDNWYIQELRVWLFHARSGGRMMREWYFLYCICDWLTDAYMIVAHTNLYMCYAAGIHICTHTLVHSQQQNQPTRLKSKMLTKALCIITNNMISPAALTMRVYMRQLVLLFLLACCACSGRSPMQLFNSLNFRWSSFSEKPDEEKGCANSN
jgi:hypothetical protein